MRHTFNDSRAVLTWVTPARLLRDRMRTALKNAMDHSQILTSLTSAIDMEAPERLTRKLTATKAFEADANRYTCKKCPYDNPIAGVCWNYALIH